MKFYLILSILLSCTFINAQTDTTKSFNFYVAASLSTTNGNDFALNSFASIELGLCVKNFNIGGLVGRGDLNFAKTDDISNYWYEIKIAASRPFGSAKCFILAGWGQYFNTGQSFIEYGGGLSYSISKFDLCLQVSNWNKTFYVSPGIAYNF